MPDASKPGCPLYEQPETLLQQLIQFDTTNPPGNEAAWVNFVVTLLRDAAVARQQIATAKTQPNLMARIPGRGAAPPLLLYGRMDVGPTTDQTWTQPPFDGHIGDGYVWGRGALDMKGGVAMMPAAVLRAAVSGLAPAEDVLLVSLSDEEAGGVFGAQHLVSEHAEPFANVRFAIGEFDGIRQVVAGSSVLSGSGRGEAVLQVASDPARARRARRAGRA